MSTEQSESTPQDETHTAPAVDITQQATTPTATMRIKNPKHVAAGKMVAERTRLARQQQKSKAPSSYLVVCGNYSMKRCPLPLGTKKCYICKVF